MIVSHGLRMPAFSASSTILPAILSRFKGLLYLWSCLGLKGYSTYDCVAGLEDAGFLGVLHHPQGDPVLDAAAGVEELTLGHFKYI